MSDPRSRIPSIDALLAHSNAQELADRYGRDRTVTALRDAVRHVRGRIAETVGSQPSSWAERVEDPSLYVHSAAEALAASDVPSLRRVINATGVVLHTNLGRAPLAAVAVEAMTAAAGEYSNLEFDLNEGKRGSRYTHCVSLLTELTGAEDALVVNNAAGALVLALNTVAEGGGGVAVSRGELVEIGGGFRIPEVLERAGARLVEVGSTNRTRLADYAAALADDGGVAVLKVHRSNFRITGFTEDVEIAELSTLVGDRALPLVHDLGSGLMVEASRLGLPDEPRASESLAAGSDVVVVSGDKLLGGPQAGILVGSSDWMARMRKNPLCRALRMDKVGLAGLEATLRLYRDPEGAVREIPTLQMLSQEAASVRVRAEATAEALSAVAGVRITSTRGAVGGGTYPGVELESWAVELTPPDGPDALASRLREGDPPVVGRIVDDGLRLDLRTVLRGQEDDLVRRVVECSG
ncbi:MAG: L-seryl-tRNA(Sec) selenium transferase [Gemmatimonadetes bacterium]|nr:L-seryl-tRNA(Sec) selenium transferase [Gemmatimonadota bacterium]NNL30144.1 L-seryl-tRNA(Sec) selenium transferase [Gemmatimonadota bacterium]